MKKKSGGCELGGAGSDVATCHSQGASDAGVATYKGRSSKEGCGCGGSADEPCIQNAGTGGALGSYTRHGDDVALNTNDALSAGDVSSAGEEIAACVDGADCEERADGGGGAIDLEPAADDGGVSQGEGGNVVFIGVDGNAAHMEG